MITLYDNAFSPFARKVRLALDHKGLHYHALDGLALHNRDKLAAVNRRVEVPTLVHDDITVVNSADIVAYLERVFPEKPVYPRDHKSYVQARAWERASDSAIDPIMINISYWMWAERPDAMPEGMLDRARADMATVYDALNRALADREFICGELSIADLALFPHLAAAKSMQVPFERALLGWYKRMRALPICNADLERTRAYLAQGAALDVERKKIFWRGDRIEWIVARGFHKWFMREIEEDRVIWPGLGVPG